MKKTFKITGTNKAPERQIDSIKFEIKKYLTRERKKPITGNADFWDFDCKVGTDAVNSETVPAHEINKAISTYAKNEPEEVYIEIIAKAGFKQPKSD